MTKDFGFLGLGKFKTNWTGDYRIGASFGIYLDVPMRKVGSFQPGVNFVQKGMSRNITQGNQEVKVKTHLDYVEFPLNVVFRIPVTSGHIVLGAGPAPAFCTSGKRLYDQSGNSKGTEKIKIGDETSDELNWVDFGLNGIAGYEFNNGLSINAVYNRGINRLSVGGDEAIKLYNRYFALRVAILVKGKKK